MTGRMADSKRGGKRNVCGTGSADVVDIGGGVPAEGDTDWRDVIRRREPRLRVLRQQGLLRRRQRTCGNGVCGLSFRSSCP